MIDWEILTDDDKVFVNDRGDVYVLKPMPPEPQPITRVEQDLFLSAVINWVLIAAVMTAGGYGLWRFFPACLVDVPMKLTWRAL